MCFSSTTSRLFPRRRLSSATRLPTRPRLPAPSRFRLPTTVRSTASRRRLPRTTRLPLATRHEQRWERLWRSGRLWFLWQIYPHGLCPVSIIVKIASLGCQILCILNIWVTQYAKMDLNIRIVSCCEATWLGKPHVKQVSPNTGTPIHRPTK